MPTTSRSPFGWATASAFLDASLLTYYRVVIPGSHLQTSYACEYYCLLIKTKPERSLTVYIFIILITVRKGVIILFL